MLRLFWRSAIGRRWGCGRGGWGGFGVGGSAVSWVVWNRRAATMYGDCCRGDVLLRGYHGVGLGRWRRLPAACVFRICVPVPRVAACGDHVHYMRVCLLLLWTLSCHAVVRFYAGPRRAERAGLAAPPFVGELLASSSSLPERVRFV
jgi:hypothetical protein